MSKKDSILEFLGALRVMHKNFDHTIDVLERCYKEKLDSLPFKVGDRVALKKTYDWHSPSFHAIQKGEQGTVKEVTLYSAGASYLVKFDDQDNTSHSISEADRLVKVKP